MPIDTEAGRMATTAVLHYFEGERREMLAILGVSVVFALATALFFFAARDGFAKALVVTVWISAALLSATAGSLLARDAGLRTQLTSAIESRQADAALTAERGRMSDVISKYPYYRYLAVLFGALAFAALLLSRQGWLHGVAAGLLLLVVAQITIDHYSEQRAKGYSNALAGVRPF